MDAVFEFEGLQNCAAGCLKSWSLDQAKVAAGKYGVRIKKSLHTPHRTHSLFFSTPEPSVSKGCSMLSTSTRTLEHPKVGILQTDDTRV